MDPNHDPDQHSQLDADPDAVSAGPIPPRGLPFPPPQRIVIEQPGGAVLRVVRWLGWAGLLICIPIIVGQTMAYSSYFDTTGNIIERHHSLNKVAVNKVAIIDLSGTIVSGDGFVKRQIDRIRQDKNVKAVILRVNSPGGTITGSDYIYHHLKKLKEDRRIPLVVSMGSMAASGGYYVAMAVGDQEDCIFAEPTTATGSIGVIIPHYDLSGLLAKHDIKNDSISSHPRKQMLSMTKPMSDEDRQIVQGYVDESFNRFKEIIKQGRPMFRDDDAALEQLATGQVFMALQAKENRLIDKIGFIEDAIERAIELAGLKPENARVIGYKRPPSVWDIASLAHAKSQGFDLSTLLDLTVPRAYYMCTWATPMTTTAQP